jgi:hypothetical protein
MLKVFKIISCLALLLFSASTTHLVSPTHQQLTNTHQLPSQHTPDSSPVHAASAEDTHFSTNSAAKQPESAQLPSALSAAEGAKSTGR